ncbi:MAG: alanine--tRNA ligase [Thermaerobacter sp.]|nr:alanine--tRNA ligase [Thermaerobacter sp.]
MQSSVIRQKFLDFFENRGHQRVLSSPLVPAGDPTLLFTNSGMVQFKDVFLGLESRSYQRAVTVQKCMRAGGKHNDLDQVGRTARHQTFFEMLGNFSFGDYFKRDAIRMAWTFLTEELGIARDTLWVTVFETDDEAFSLWQEVAGVSPDRIVRMGEHDNFWSMGDTGPCGPCSEIFVDRGLAYACGPDCGLGRCECDRIQEIWNLVFMQYDRDASGNLTPLPRPSIDTGMGLERVTAYLQGVDSNFDTDLLFPLIQEVERLSRRTYDRGAAGMAFRVIADHIRAIVFLLAEGVSFSNEGRGFVMRRILRRAVRYGLGLGFDSPFLWRLVPVVGTMMGAAYPEVAVGEPAIAQRVQEEEERFRLTLTAGMKVLADKLQTVPAGGVLSGRDAFLLHDTYGFPLDLTVDAAAERGLTVDAVGFEAAMEEQRDRARADRAGLAESLPALGGVTFTGHDTLIGNEVAAAALFVGSDRVERLENGMSGWVWLDRTPFYPEGGGQVGDAGRMSWPDGRAVVLDTVKSGGDIWHLVSVEAGYLVRGQTVTAEVDRERREGAMRNHTGTHLLHAALRRVLGDGVRQTGSLVAPDRLRFDFSYPRAMTPQQIREVEDLVNRWVLEDRVVTTRQMSKDDALADGALAFFGDKYGESVRVVAVEGASRELCGGTHCQRTGQIGLFAIVQELSIGAGNRRVEAVTGWNSVWRLRRLSAVSDALLAQFRGAETGELPQRVAELAAEVKRLETELAEVGRRAREAAGRQLTEQAIMVDGQRMVIADTGAESAGELRQILDGLKERVDGAVLTARQGDRASLLVFLGPGLRARGLSARGLVQELAGYIEGGGGGRDDMSQAGGKHPDGIGPLLEAAHRLIAGKLRVG